MYNKGSDLIKSKCSKPVTVARAQTFPCPVYPSLSHTSEKLKLEECQTNFCIEQQITFSASSRSHLALRQAFLSSSLLSSFFLSHVGRCEEKGSNRPEFIKFLSFLLCKNQEIITVFYASTF